MLRVPLVELCLQIKFLSLGKIGTFLEKVMFSAWSYYHYSCSFKWISIALSKSHFLKNCITFRQLNIQSRRQSVLLLLHSMRLVVLLLYHFWNFTFLSVCLLANSEACTWFLRILYFYYSNYSIFWLSFAHFIVCRWGRWMLKKSWQLLAFT